MGINLFDYQQGAVAAIHGHWREWHSNGRPSKARKPLVVMATGCGKTETLLSQVAVAVRKGKRVLWVSHRRELVEDPVKRFKRYHPDMAGKAAVCMASSGAPLYGRAFTSASKETLAYHDEKTDTYPHMDAYFRYGSPALIIIDEAHHTGAPKYGPFLEQLARRCNTSPLWVGLTATPEHPAGLSRIWDMVYDYDIVSAINAGNLTEPWVVEEFFTEAKAGNGFAADKALAEERAFINHIADLWGTSDKARMHMATRWPLTTSSDKKHMTLHGRSTLVFVNSIDMARKVAGELCKRGLRAAWVSGDDPKRVQKIEQMRNGQIDVCVNAQLLTEGTDIPRVNAIVLARSYDKWPFFVQTVGRGLRLFCPGLQRGKDYMTRFDFNYGYHRGHQDCLIIDVKGGTRNHRLEGKLILGNAPMCKFSEDGEHDWVRKGKYGAVCNHEGCGARASCYKSVVAGISTAHQWGEDGICTNCGAQQCPTSPTNKHDWQEISDDKMGCTFCGAEINKARLPMKPKTRKAIKVGFAVTYVTPIVDGKAQPKDERQLRCLRTKTGKVWTYVLAVQSAAGPVAASTWDIYTVRDGQRKKREARTGQTWEQVTVALSSLMTEDANIDARSEEVKMRAVAHFALPTIRYR